MARTKAALFTILSNRFDWQLFLEVTVGVCNGQLKPDTDLGTLL
ncbi:hypothetical protein [Yersinia enterocolitica]|nr:hypothetical protein [Yersinia enterocolitica]